MIRENIIGKAFLFTICLVVIALSTFGIGSAANSTIFTYTGDILPSDDEWVLICYDTYESIAASVEDGVLHLTDPYTYPGSALSYMREWPTSPDYINVAEFNLKCVSNTGGTGILIGTNDDNHNMFYAIFPDRIQSRYVNETPDLYQSSILGEVYYFNTTSQFNTYKAIIDSETAKLYINGELVLEQPAGTGRYRGHEYPHIPDWGVEFGVASSPYTAEVFYDEVRAYQIPKTPGYLFTYTGDVLPSDDGWVLICYDSYESTCANIEGGTLHLTDPYTYSGSALSYMREWPTSPDYINVAEFNLKCVSNTGRGGILIGTNDDNHNMMYVIYPDRIQSRYVNETPDLYQSSILGEVYYFNTTSQFNTYKAIIDSETAKLYINGELVLEQPAGTGRYRGHEYPHIPDWGVEFGVASSPYTAEVFYDEVRVYALAKVPGDITGDMIVNVFDLQQLAWAFMSHPGDPNWNENADLNCDGVVNVFDLQILAWNFMKRYEINLVVTVIPDKANYYMGESVNLTIAVKNNGPSRNLVFPSSCLANFIIISESGAPICFLQLYCLAVLIDLPLEANETKILLNTLWNFSDTGGNPVPPGRYFIHGWMVAGYTHPEIHGEITSIELYAT